MKINDEGLKLIMSFEGCKLKAYQDSVGVWTIGWGHTGNVKAGQTITQKQADNFLLKDLAKFEKAVNDLKRDFNENQFSALVSFAYNCGPQNLKQLCDGRSAAEIGSKMLLYNKAGGRVLAGLTRRRKAENRLYMTPVESKVYPVPNRVLSKGDRCESVMWLQDALNRKGADLVIDGKFGENTEKALKKFQEKIFVTGKLDDQTKSALLR